MNKVILLGRLGSDPEFKATSGGEMCKFSVATSEKFQSDGEIKERTDWHKIVVWGKLAQTCSKYLTKGSQVAIEGRLHTRSWEDDRGKKKFVTEVIAEDVKFLDLKKTSDGGLPL